MSRKMKHTSKRAFVRVCATALSCVLLLAMLPLMRSALADDTQYATVIVDSCNVRNKAGTVNTTVIGVLRSGGRVHVYDVVTLSNDPSGYNKWCHVKYSSNGQQFDGYVVDEFLAKDADINSDPAFETEISGFPDSYKPYLRSLRRSTISIHSVLIIPTALLRKIIKTRLNSCSALTVPEFTGMCPPVFLTDLSTASAQRSVSRPERFMPAVRWDWKVLQPTSIS